MGVSPEDKSVDGLILQRFSHTAGLFCVPGVADKVGQNNIYVESQEQRSKEPKNKKQEQNKSKEL